LRFLKEQYLEIWNYLRQNRWWCIVILIAIAEAIIYSVLNIEASDAYGTYAEAAMPAYSSLFAFILFENLKTAVKIVLVGIVPFCIFSFFITMSSIFGLVASFKLYCPALPPGAIAAASLPHAVVEVPAIIITILASFLLSKSVTFLLYWLIRRRPALTAFRKDLVHICRMVVFLIIPMILIAAVLEAFVTTRVVAFLF